MTTKKIRFIDEKQNNKEKEKLKFSREKLLDLSRKKTFKAHFLPNINSIKDEVNNFKKERENWKKSESKPMITGIKYFIPMGGIIIKIKFMSIKYFQLGLL